MSQQLSPEKLVTSLFSGKYVCVWLSLSCCLQPYGCPLFLHRPHKPLHARLAEQVDRLLRVAHQEDRLLPAVPLLGQQLDQLILDRRRVLHLVDEKKMGTRAGFIHVPALPEQATLLGAEKTPSMTLELMLKGIETAIEAIAQRSVPQAPAQPQRTGEKVWIPGGVAKR